MNNIQFEIRNGPMESPSGLNNDQSEEEPMDRVSTSQPNAQQIEEQMGKGKITPLVHPRRHRSCQLVLQESTFNNYIFMVHI